MSVHFGGNEMFLVSRAKIIKPQILSKSTFYHQIQFDWNSLVASSHHQLGVYFCRKWDYKEPKVF